MAAKRKLGKSPAPAPAPAKKAKEEDAEEGLFSSRSFADLGLHPTLCSHLQGTHSPLCTQ
jgi:ATP-dependent RNA helicase DDX31/DBP7